MESGRPALPRFGGALPCGRDVKGAQTRNAVLAHRRRPKSVGLQCRLNCPRGAATSTIASDHPDGSVTCGRFGDYGVAALRVEERMRALATRERMCYK